MKLKNKMVIKIITFHYAHNYGAVLQAYALRTYLRKKGHDVNIANYYNEHDAQKYKDNLPYEYSIRQFRHIRMWRSVARRNLDILYAQKVWRKQCHNFEKFIYSTILEGSSEKETVPDLSSSKVDCLIAGSDQIWNTYITGGIDKVYFLDFPTRAKKIFYGASNGKSSIPEEIQDYVAEVLADADHISCREEALAESVSKILKREVNTVVDPTLLLEKRDYEVLIPDTKFETERFVFVYFISESTEMMKIAEYIARILNLKLIELHYYARRDLRKHHQRADMGPEEFLWHMKNAEFIITNSFHGLVFSIIFQKIFYGVFREDSRKDNLLSKLGLLSRKIQDIAEVNLDAEIDYQSVIERLCLLKNDSELFLSQI